MVPLSSGTGNMSVVKSTRNAESEKRERTMGLRRECERVKAPSYILFHGKINARHLISGTEGIIMSAMPVILYSMHGYSCHAEHGMARQVTAQLST